jgi:predicted DNA-binding transcriptional regulator AlpA
VILDDLLREMEGQAAAAEAKQSRVPEAAITRFWLERVRELEMSREGDGEGSTGDGMISVKAAAKRIGISPRWIYKRVSELPFAHRFPGGAIRCREGELERWLAGR